jgi:hypothetical protein
MNNPHLPSRHRHPAATLRHRSGGTPTRWARGGTIEAIAFAGSHRLQEI